MAYPAIPSMTERNYVGLCHIDWVDVQDIATWPDEISGNLVGDIVLVEGAVWNRVELEDDTGALFNERWQLLGGAQHSVASITGDVAKDRLSLMPHLWRMKGRRCVARMTTRNGDVLILGTKLEPAVALVKRRTAGQDVDSDRNQYSVEIGVSRRVPVPFYQGVVEEPPTDPGECPTVGELVAPLSWTEIEALLDEDQLADAQASICETPPAPVLCDVIEAALAGSGPAGITLTSGANEDFLPQTGTISGKPVYFLVNFDGTGFSAEATWTGTEWYLTDGVNEWTSAEDVATPGDVVTWTGDTPLPTVVTSGPVSPSILLDCLTTEQEDTLFGEMVDDRTWAEIEAELDGTQLAAAEASICEVAPAPVLCDVIDAALEPEAGDGVYMSLGNLTGFLPETGTTNGRPSYSVANWAGTGLTASINWEGSNWYATDGDGDFGSNEDVATPDLCTLWFGTGSLRVSATPSPALLLGCLDPGQVAQIDGKILTTDESVLVDTVSPGGAWIAPQIQQPYVDAAGDAQLTVASDTEYSGGTLRPAAQIPRRQMLVTGGGATGKYASVGDLVANTLPTIPQQVFITWAAGAGDTIGVVFPANMQGVAFSFVSETVSNGTITVSVNNGSSFAAAPFTAGVAKVIFRRTTTTNESTATYTTA